MTVVITSVVALALGVAALVAVGWSTLAILARIQVGETSTDHRLIALSKSFRAGLAQTASAKLAAEVADLHAAVDELAAAHKRNIGKIWGRLGADAAAEQAADPPGDPRLELQRANADRMIPGGFKREG